MKAGNLIGATILALSAAVCNADSYSFTPQESNALFKNPGKGWTFYYWDHGMRDGFNACLKGSGDYLEDVPGIGVVYRARGIFAGICWIR